MTGCAIIGSPISTQLGEGAKVFQSRCSGEACKEGQHNNKVAAGDHCDLRIVSSCRLVCRASLVVFIHFELTLAHSNIRTYLADRLPISQFERTSRSNT